MLVEIETSFQRFRTCVFLRETCATPTTQVSWCRIPQTMGALDSPKMRTTQSIHPPLVNESSSLLLHRREKTRRDDSHADPESSCPCQGSDRIARASLDINFCRLTCWSVSVWALSRIECRLGVLKPQKSHRVSPSPIWFVLDYCASGLHVPFCSRCQLARRTTLAYSVTVAELFWFNTSWSCRFTNFTRQSAGIESFSMMAFDSVCQNTNHSLCARLRSSQYTVLMASPPSA